MGMTDKILSQKLDFMIEQKILEFFSDPDYGLSLHGDFLRKLKTRKNSSKFISHQKVLQKYGLR